MPPTAFDDILGAPSRRDRRDMGEVDTEEYRIRHERRYQTSAAGMDEARTRGRERERDVEGSGGSGSGGGFTAVNG